jgi:ankyrin repeat protein
MQGSFNASAVTDPGQQLLAAAARGQKGLEEALSLVAAGAPVDKKDGEGRTALMHAAARGLGDLVAALLAGGADPNAVDGNGDTPVNHAVKHSYIRIAKILIGAGADVTIRNRQGENAIAFALARNNEKNAERLKRWTEAATGKPFVDDQLEEEERAAQREMERQRGIRLIEAAQNGDTSGGEALALIEAGASVVEKDGWGRTALMYAAARNQKEVVRRLLYLGADPDAADHEGNTALIFAISHSFTGIAKMLIEGGADISIANKHGQTAAGCARQRKNEKNATRVEAWAKAAAAKPVSTWEKDGLPVQREVEIGAPLKLKRKGAAT